MPHRLCADYKIHDLGMTSNGYFTINAHTVDSVYTAIKGDVRKRTVIRRIFGIREKTAGLS